MNDSALARSYYVVITDLRQRAQKIIEFADYLEKESMPLWCESIEDLRAAVKPSEPEPDPPIPVGFEKKNVKLSDGIESLVLIESDEQVGFSKIEPPAKQPIQLPPVTVEAKSTLPAAPLAAQKKKSGTKEWNTLPTKKEPPAIEMENPPSQTEVDTHIITVAKLRSCTHQSLIEAVEKRWPGYPRIRISQTIMSLLRTDRMRKYGRAVSSGDPYVYSIVGGVIHIPEDNPEARR